MSDNGTSFTRAKFQNYCSSSNIKLIRSSPFHPASNGLAKKAVQTVKSSLKKKQGDLEFWLLQDFSVVQITYCPKHPTGETPAQLLMGQLPRSCLSDTIITDNHQRQLTSHSNAAKDRAFSTGDSVYAINFTEKPRWGRGVLRDDVRPVTQPHILGIQSGG